MAAKPVRSKKYLVWMDCEMTGLDPETHVLLEIATIITNYDLEIIARGPVLAIRHPKSKLDMMDAWCRRTHGGSEPARGRPFPRPADRRHHVGAGDG